jgi:hypothetical protein
MRTAAANAVLQVLADAGQPLTRAEITGRAATRLAPRPVMVIPGIDYEEPYGTDNAAGSAWTEQRQPTGYDIETENPLYSLQRDGWVITRHRGDTYSLAGRTPVPAISGLPPRPPASLPADPADAMLAWLMSGGREGRRRSTFIEWAGRLIMDDEFARAAGALRGRGYGVDCYQGDWWRITGTPEVPMLPPPPLGSDVAMITDPGEEPPVPVGVTEIAERAGVERATVEAWTRRPVGFPAPQWPVGGRRAWDWREVRAWLQRTGRLAA